MKFKISIGGIVVAFLFMFSNYISAQNLATQEPQLQSLKTSGNKIEVKISNVKKGFITINNERPSGFTIGGKDGVFYPADIQFSGNKIILSSAKVKKPVAVRYGFGSALVANISTSDGKQLKPFRTDNFNNISYARWFADSEMRRFPEAWQLDHGKRLYFGYSQGVGALAMLKMWKFTGEKHYYDYVEKWVDSLIANDGTIYEYHVETYNIDYINSGKVLFDVYKLTGNEKYKLAMEKLINQMKNHPRTFDGGYWHKLIYQHQIWLDGIYMASPFLAQYGMEFNKPEWIDEAAHQITLCYNKCYDPKTGLLYHAWDESRNQRWANPETGLSPNFWGRSIGWYFMAVVDALDFIPDNHPKRAELTKIVKQITEAVEKYQSPAGLWYQVLDKGGKEGNYEEASVTSMFMYSIAKAVSNGYIDKKHRVTAEKAQKGLIDKLIAVNNDGTLTLTKCCAVAGLGGNPYRDGSYEYYVNEKIRDNDAKATGPFIMGCIELEK